MPRGLDDVLWNNYRGLERTLARNGYPKEERINGFALYQLRKPDQLNNQLGTFLALRESRLEPNGVETAIFWTGSSLEEAVEALGKLPAKTLGETVRDRVFSYGSIGPMLAIGIAAGLVANSIGVGVTGSVGIGLGAEAIYLAGKAAYSLLRSYSQWQSALSVFNDHVKGRGALSRTIEFAEIYAH